MDVADLLNALYLTIAVMLSPVTTRRWFDHFTYGTRRGDLDDYIAAFGLGLFTAAVWPVTILVALLWKPFVRLLFGRLP